MMPVSTFVCFDHVLWRPTPSSHLGRRAERARHQTTFHRAASTISVRTARLSIRIKAEAKKTDPLGGYSKCACIILD